MLALASAQLGAQSSEVRMLVQSSPLAGFQYYQGRQLWDEIKVGDALALVRESDNPHDHNAVRVEWRGHKPGYVPRRDKQAGAQDIDRRGRRAGPLTRLLR